MGEIIFFIVIAVILAFKLYSLFGTDEDQNSDDELREKYSKYIYFFDAKEKDNNDQESKEKLVEGYESSDIMNFLSEKNVYIRAGNHCAKLTKSLFGLSTCRVSLGIYNTEDDIYKLYSSLKEMLK